MTQFRYVRVPGGRRATVAFDVRNEGNTVVVQAGVSYRNPRDKYLKDYGEAKANGRLTQLKLGDGWRLAQQHPEKYITLTVHNQPSEEVLGEFDKLVDLIVRGFTPAAVEKQQRKDSV